MSVASASETTAAIDVTSLRLHTDECSDWAYHVGSKCTCSVRWYSRPDGLVAIGDDDQMIIVSLLSDGSAQWYWTFDGKDHYHGTSPAAGDGEATLRAAADVVLNAFSKAEIEAHQP